MKVMVITAAGWMPPVVPTPQPGAAEVPIGVGAAALNHVETAKSGGHGGGSGGPSTIPGIEGAGEVFAQINALLAQAGTSKDHLLTETIHIRNVKFNAAGMNVAWSAWLHPERKPVRDCIESAFQLPVLMEIVVTAAVPN